MNKIKYSLYLFLLMFVLSFDNSVAFDAKILDNPYNESVGVMMDITSTNSPKEDAKQQAIYEAFKKLLQRILKDKYSTELLNKYNDKILDFINSVKVIKENTNDNMYKAEYIVVFRENAINRILEKEGDGNYISKVKTILLPVYYIKGEPVIWSDNNLWTLAWEQVLREGEGRGIILPIGDIEDMQYLKISDILSGDIKQLKRFADKYNAQNLIISEAIFNSDYLEVIINKYSFAQYKHNNRADNANENKSERKVQHYNFSKGTVSNDSLKQDFLYAISSDVVKKIKEERGFRTIKKNKIESIEVKYYAKNMKDYLLIHNTLEKLKFVKQPEFLEISSQSTNVKLYYKGGMAGFISYMYTNGIKLRNINSKWQMSFL